MLSMFHGLLWSIQVERCGDYAFWLARQICLGEGWCLDHSMNWRDFVQTDPFDPLCLSLDCVQPQRDLGGTMANLWNQADLDKAEFEKKSAPWPEALKESWQDSWGELPDTPKSRFDDARREFQDASFHYLRHMSWLWQVWAPRFL